MNSNQKSAKYYISFFFTFNLKTNITYHKGISLVLTNLYPLFFVKFYKNFPTYV